MSVTEDADTKRSRFVEFARVLPKDSLLATCASGAGLDAIGAAITAPDRLIGLCFFDPVHETGQVRVALAAGTSRATAERVLAFVAALGRQAVLQGPAGAGV